MAVDPGAERCGRPHLHQLRLGRRRRSPIRIRTGLEQAGVSCWIAPRDIESGTSFPGRDYRRHPVVRRARAAAHRAVQRLAARPERGRARLQRAASRFWPCSSARSRRRPTCSTSSPRRTGSTPTRRSTTRTWRSCAPTSRSCWPASAFASIGSGARPSQRRRAIAAARRPLSCWSPAPSPYIVSRPRATPRAAAHCNQPRRGAARPRPAGSHAAAAPTAPAPPPAPAPGAPAPTPAAPALRTKVNAADGQTYRVDSARPLLDGLFGRRRRLPARRAAGAHGANPARLLAGAHRGDQRAIREADEADAARRGRGRRPPGRRHGLERGQGLLRRHRRPAAHRSGVGVRGARRLARALLRHAVGGGVVRAQQRRPQPPRGAEGAQRLRALRHARQRLRVGARSLLQQVRRHHRGGRGAARAERVGRAARRRVALGRQGRPREQPLRRARGLCRRQRRLPLRAERRRWSRLQAYGRLQTARCITGTAAARTPSGSRAS